jgi:hypothetical protein
LSGDDESVRDELADAVEQGLERFTNACNDDVQVPFERPDVFLAIFRHKRQIKDMPQKEKDAQNNAYGQKQEVQHELYQGNDKIAQELHSCGPFEKKPGIGWNRPSLARSQSFPDFTVEEGVKEQLYGGTIQ